LSEFDFIRDQLSALSHGYPGALNLTDDAALLSCGPGEELVLTQDTLVCGVHFLENDPADLVAKKALRVNLSDLAAMGADPVAVMSSIAWPEVGGDALREAWVRGMAEDLDHFALPLIGGDTTVTPGPWTLTVTAIGKLPTGSVLMRSGAQAGDMVCVTGTIGDAGLGLKQLRGELSLSEAAAGHVTLRYQCPEPRLVLGAKLRGIAHAAIDVSDGLAADAAHIAQTSGVGLALNLADMPRSDASAEWLAGQGDLDTALAALASAGDDYELLVCLPAAAFDAAYMAALQSGTSLTPIGEVTDGSGVTLLGMTGQTVTIDTPGFTHF
jgi:thiamine-monophosphate kinase